MVDALSGIGIESGYSDFMVYHIQCGCESICMKVGGHLEILAILEYPNENNIVNIWHVENGRLPHWHSSFGSVP